MPALYTITVNAQQAEQLQELLLQVQSYTLSEEEAHERMLSIIKPILDHNDLPLPEPGDRTVFQVERTPYSVPGMVTGG